MNQGMFKMCACESVCVGLTHMYILTVRLPAPPLANDRRNKTFVKDEAIHHVVQGTIKTPAGLKAQTRVPLHRAWRDRGRRRRAGG